MKFTLAWRKYNQAESQAKINYNIKLRQDLTGNDLSSKKWWSIVNSLSGRTGHSDIPVIEHNGVAYSTAGDKADVFCQAFAEKCRLSNADDQPLGVKQYSTTKLEKIIFKPNDVRRILQKLKPDKASGPDQISTRVLKECSAELAGPLCRLFHLCYSCGVFPNQWKTASVTPVHKKDSRADPSKYRPISLLSVVSKVMEAAVQKQLQNYLLRNHLFSSRQFGFRPDHSTADLLTIFSQTWNTYLDKNGEVCIIALDIKGAFDKVWQNGLCAKLKSKGITGKLLITWLQSYMEDRLRLFSLVNLLTHHPSMHQSRKAQYLVHFCSPSLLMILLMCVRMRFTFMLMTARSLHQ